MISEGYDCRRSLQEKVGNYREGIFRKEYPNPLKKTRYFLHHLKEQYAASFHNPLQCGVRVTVVRQQPGGEGYLIEQEEETIKARNVVLATGAYTKPKLPTASAALCRDICQMHTSEYRNSQMLPPGAVVVGGMGQSGCQIAEDLYDSGRQVYLSTSSFGRALRRYRGKDISR